MTKTDYFQIPINKYVSTKNIGRALEEVAEGLITVKNDEPKQVLFLFQKVRMLYNESGGNMKIEKFTRQSNGQYKLNLDNNTNIILHEDLILKYELLIHKEIDEQMIDKLLDENTSYIAYDLALNYLKVKMRCQKEIREYLRKKQVNETLIDNSINLLTKQGYLNDEIFTKAFIHDKIYLSNDGPYKIKEQLLKLEIDEDIINSNLNKFDKVLEIEKINKIINKQVKINKNKSAFALKKKLTEYLVTLGYTKELVINEVNKVKFNDEELLKKEYDKMYQKLSKKYSGKELEYKIKSKLYQKGFYME